MTREELGIGYYKLNIPKTSERRQRNSRVADVFKQAFDVSADELMKSVSIGEATRATTTEPQSSEG